MRWNKTSKENGSKELTVTIDGRVITLNQAITERNEEALQMFRVWHPVSVVQIERERE